MLNPLSVFSNFPSSHACFPISSHSHHYISSLFPVVILVLDVASSRGNSEAPVGVALPSDLGALNADVLVLNLAAGGDGDGDGPERVVALVAGSREGNRLAGIPTAELGNVA